MLETEEVDEDYFTPAVSTSLAEVFSRKADEESENGSLKYTPPKPETNVNPEQSKATKCVYACVLSGFQWTNDKYAPKGKLGFAIVKSKQTGESNIILYNSSKVTLSQATIKPNFEAAIKSKTNISYYDNKNNYWSMYGSEEEVKTIQNTLTSLNARVTYSINNPYNAKEPPKQKKNSLLDFLSRTSKDSAQSEEESNTESSDIPIKHTNCQTMTKQTTISQATTPLRSALRKNQEEQTSESDTDSDSDSEKGIKVGHKTNVNPNSILDVGINTVRLKKVTRGRRDENPIVTMYHHSGSNSDATDGKLSNSELRKNMNKISEKMEELLNKVQAIDSQSSCNHNFQYEVTQKLLGEYEKKISYYQQCLTEVETGKPKLNNELILELQQTNMQKEKEISKLCDQIKILNNKIDALSSLTLVQEKNFGQQLLNLRHHVISDKPDRSLPANKKNIVEKKKIKSKSIKPDHIEEIVKTLMSEAMQTMFEQFDEGNTYTGKKVKDILKSTVKNISVKLTNDMDS